MRGKTRGLSRKQRTKPLQGYHSKVKGLLGEAYSLRSKPWVRRRAQHLREARRVAKRLGKGYKVVPVAGTIKLNGKETWDEAILIIREAGADGSAPEAILYTAAQTKVEKQISAIDQVMRDRLREAGLETYQPAILEIAGKPPRAFVLRPNPEAVKPYRYLLHAEGGKLSKAATQLLNKERVGLRKLELDMTIEQFNRIADHLLNTSLKLDLAKIATKVSP